MDSSLPSRSLLTQHESRRRKQCSVMLPHPSPSPISQTARCVYLQTADQRLLNITKAKSIIHKRDKCSKGWYICCCWEFSHYLIKHCWPAFRVYHIFVHRWLWSCTFWSVFQCPLVWKWQITDVKSSSERSYTAGRIHPSDLMRS